MSQNREDKAEMPDFINLWTEMANSFWTVLTRMEPGGSFTGKNASKEDKSHPFFNAKKSFESSTNIIQALTKIMSSPENIDAMVQGMNMLPDLMMQSAQQLWDSYFIIHKKVADQAAKIGRQTKAYSFEDIDPSIFENLREIYEKEFQKFYHVPQLGLTRFYQERLQRLADKYNLFQSTLGEFMYMLYIPIEKSSMVMQEKVEEMVSRGEIRDNVKDYYKMWIRILEGHYMKLLQSPEYTQVMGKTIDALADYRNAREEVFCDILQHFPIPTNKEMDELYRDFYLLNKRVKALEKKFRKKEEEKL